MNGYGIQQMYIKKKKNSQQAHMCGFNARSRPMAMLRRPKQTKGCNTVPLESLTKPEDNLFNHPENKQDFGKEK